MKLNILDIPEMIWMMYKMESTEGKLFIRKPTIISIPLDGYEVKETHANFEFTDGQRVVTVNKRAVHVVVSL